MKKILFVATVDQHIRHFHVPYLKMFKEQGYIVHIASNHHEEYGFWDKKFNVPFSRFPFSINNFRAAHFLKKIIKKNQYDIIHCHTPVSSFLCRIIFLFSNKKKRPRIIYTAHGFHFFKGSRLFNWCLYYPIEYICSSVTDDLITINDEDYKVAQNFRSERVHFIEGVGVNLEKFNPPSRSERIKLKRKYDFDKTILTYVAELSPRKNQLFIIEIANELLKRSADFQFILVGSGKGKYKAELERQIKEHHLEEFIKLLGYRNDVADLMKASDVCFTCSKQEGLPVNVIEGMGTGLPIIASNVRGNRDLVNKNNGFLFEFDNISELIREIEIMINNKAVRESLGQKSFATSKKYSLNQVLEKMITVYFK